MAEVSQPGVVQRPGLGRLPEPHERLVLPGVQLHVVRVVQQPRIGNKPIPAHLAFKLVVSEYTRPSRIPSSIAVP